MRDFKVGDRIKYVNDTGDKTSQWSTTITLGKIYIIARIDSYQHIRIEGKDIGYAKERFIHINCQLPQNIKVL